MKPIFLLLGTAFVLSILTPAHAKAAQQDSREPLLQVAVRGAGRPVLFIPGYGCSGEVWAETVRHFDGEFRCHTVTLPGFAGAPAFLQGPYLPKFRDQLIAYLRANVSVPVTIVGHSLGGFLALSVATTAPELIERVIVVDGLPFLPAAYDAAALPKMDEAGAERYAAMLKQLSPEERRRQKEAALADMISDPTCRTGVAGLAALSDPVTEAWAMAELMATDLRTDLAKLQCPIAVFGAFQNGNVPGMAAEIERRYRSQFAAAPNCELHMIGAKHFLMYEQPAWLWSGMNTFLKTGHAAR